MNKTRTEILTELERQKTATAAQLSRRLQVGAADVRFHLQQLVAEGMIEEAGKQRTGEPGRPRRLYRLAPPARQSNLAGLAGILLQVMTEELGISSLATVAERLAISSPEEKLPPGKRLFQAVQRLNDLHYLARWEAHAESPRIVLGNCPYAAIIDDYPILCQLDSQLIEHLTGLPAEQSAKLETNPRGEIFCMFELVEQTPALPGGN